MRRPGVFKYSSTFRLYACALGEQRGALLTGSFIIVLCGEDVGTVLIALASNAEGSPEVSFVTSKFCHFVMRKFHRAGQDEPSY